MVGTAEAIEANRHQLGELAYHVRFRPHLRADLVIPLVEGNQRPNTALNRTRVPRPSFGGRWHAPVNSAR